MDTKRTMRASTICALALALACGCATRQAETGSSPATPTRSLAYDEVPLQGHGTVRAARLYDGPVIAASNLSLVVFSNPAASDGFPTTKVTEDKDLLGFTAMLLAVARLPSLEIVYDVSAGGDAFFLNPMIVGYDPAKWDAFPPVAFLLAPGQYRILMQGSMLLGGRTGGKTISRQTPVPLEVRLEAGRVYSLVSVLTMHDGQPTSGFTVMDRETKRSASITPR